MVDLSADEQGFHRAAFQFVADYAVEFVAVEAIVWIPEHGLAGTVDWIGEINGRVVLGDWKTRAKRHAAYPEEAAQLGCYSLALAAVVGEFPGELVPMPEIEGLMVVSLKNDGSYAAYPIDLDLARQSALAMIENRDTLVDIDVHGTRAVGHPATGQAEIPVDQDLLVRRQWLRARVRALPPEAKDVAARLWPGDIPKNADVLSSGQIDSLAVILDRAESQAGAPFFEPDPALPEAAAGTMSPRRNPPAGRTKRSTSKKATTP